jgi:hypothetical protein
MFGQKLLLKKQATAAAAIIFLGNVVSFERVLS